MKHILDDAAVEAFRRRLTEDEKSPATIRKYLRDLQGLQAWAGDSTAITKELVIAYKQQLLEQYGITTVNGALAALNSFFKSAGWYDCVVRSLRVQRASFRSRELSREEYFRLLAAAETRGDRRLSLVMQTLCATGIRISELRFITAEALAERQARVSLKGKTRTVLLPLALCQSLEQYVREQKIRSGSIFVTRSGMPLDRSNIFRSMKGLCQEAGVEPGKVFPHNLRHLFACTYYQAEKDLAHLADILGHSSVDTTRIYLLKSSGEQARQIEHLGLVI